MAISFGLKDVMREWDNDVDSEAERLIKRGVSPWQAVEQARDNVSRRRARKANDDEIARSTQGCGDCEPI